MKSQQLVLDLSAIRTLCESWGLPQRPFLWILEPVGSCAVGAAAVYATHGAVVDGSPERQRDGSTRGSQGSTATFSPAPFPADRRGKCGNPEKTVCSFCF